MKEIGKVNFYNGKYGLIVKDNETIEFEAKDISFNQDINIYDIVEFRVEQKFPNIKIARNIKKIDIKNSDF